MLGRHDVLRNPVVPRPTIELVNCVAVNTVPIGEDTYPRVPRPARLLVRLAVLTYPRAPSAFTVEVVELSVDLYAVRPAPVKLLVREAVLMYPSDPRLADELMRLLLAAPAGSAFVIASPRLLIAV